MLRGLAVAPVAIGELIASAQKALGYFQQQSFLSNANNLHSEENSRALIGAARTLNSVAYSLKKLGAIPAEDTRSLLILSACAFAMHGNFPSACATLNEALVGSSFT